ncbi:MAG: hypothetical protein AAF515_05120 [Pseudomonadota bacterium]
MIGTDYAIDGMGEKIQGNIGQGHYVNGSPSTASAVLAASLATTNYVSGDVTLEDGPVAGRRVRIGAKADLNITTGGTANHFVWLNPGGTVIVWQTEVFPAVVLPVGGLVDVEEHVIDIPDAVAA